MVSFLAFPGTLSAQGTCPPEAATLVARGWALFRADSIAPATDAFRRADRLCTENLDAKTGLGYVAIRDGRLAAAESTFSVVVQADSINADAWDGLTIASYQSGDSAKVMTYGRGALALRPGNDHTRGMLDRTSPDWDRPPLRSLVRPEKLAVGARTVGARFEVRDSTNQWRTFYINGVNMGVALPGKFPSEFPQDSAVYAGWLDTIATLGANTLRLYTILPPSFYRAVRAWNRTHATRPLWLVHGVWTELPPEENFEDSTWKADFRHEMRRVVDLLHGAAEIPRRPGHASGRYDADVSQWTLAYIIGREWEPYAVKEFDSTHTSTRVYKGRYLETSAAPAMDVWMAEQCDYLLSYEVDTYNAVRPIAYTNWPTLDPLRHVTESTGAEERAWRRKVGRSIPLDPQEFENDAIGLDAMLVRATALNPAGWFASYHAYPYYPDFMVNDPGYAKARSSEGPSNYFGYLRELVAHHKGVPLVISEYGVPSSRGLAHLQPQGWNHGGHDETDMARIDARLTREVRESGAAGGIIFAWMDEWFKKNWIVIDHELPRENTRQWHNMMDPEQNYGILGIYAGPEADTPVPGGDAARWLALKPLSQVPGGEAGSPATLHVGSDESYVYVALALAGMAGRPFPWDSLGVRIAIDTWRRDLGQTRLPSSEIHGDIGFEFLADFRNTADAELRITPDYNPFVGGEVIIDGDDYSRFARRPIAVVRRNDGRFDSLFVITNRSRFARDGTFIPSTGYNRGRLRYGRFAESTLVDWYYDDAAGLLELRLPWGLINVTDPSTATIMLSAAPDEDIVTTHAEGFRFGTITYRKTVSGRNLPTAGALPPLGRDGRWHKTDFPSWTWPTWGTPTFHARLKPVADSLRAVWEGH